MDFTNGSALLSYCQSEQIKISEAMLRREISLGETTKEDVYDKMRRSIEIMKVSTQNPIQNPIPSMGRLLNGEAKSVWQHSFEGNPQTLCGAAGSHSAASGKARGTFPLFQEKRGKSRNRLSAVRRISCVLQPVFHHYRGTRNRENHGRGGASRTGTGTQPGA